MLVHLQPEATPLPLLYFVPLLQHLDDNLVSRFLLFLINAHGDQLVASPSHTASRAEYCSEVYSEPINDTKVPQVLAGFLVILSKV